MQGEKRQGNWKKISRIKARMMVDKMRETGIGAGLIVEAKVGGVGMSKVEVVAVMARDHLPEAVVEAMMARDHLTEAVVEAMMTRDYLPEAVVETMMARDHLLEAVVEAMMAIDHLPEVEVSISEVVGVSGVTKRVITRMQSTKDHLLEGVVVEVEGNAKHVMTIDASTSLR